MPLLDRRRQFGSLKKNAKWRSSRNVTRCPTCSRKHVMLHAVELSWLASEKITPSRFRGFIQRNSLSGNRFTLSDLFHKGWASELSPKSILPCDEILPILQIEK